MKKKLFAGYSPFEKRNFLFIYLLIAVPVVQFAVFWGYVNFSSFFLAFKDPFGDWSFENFGLLWDLMTKGDIEGYKFFDMFRRSITLWTVANLISFPISLATTYVLFRRVCGHYVYRICYMIPGIVGGVVWAAMVKQMIASSGPIPYILNNLGVLKKLGVDESTGMSVESIVLSQGLFASAKTAFPTLVILTFILGFVGGSAVVTGAYARIPDELYDVGKLDGIGFWREFFTVAIPFIWPTISTLFTFSLCSMFVADGNVFVYTGGTGKPEMSTIGFYLTYKVYRISQSANQANPPYGEISALGMLITAITVPVVIIGRRLLEKITPPVES